MLARAQGAFQRRDANGTNGVLAQRTQRGTKGAGRRHCLPKFGKRTKYSITPARFFPWVGGSSVITDEWNANAPLF